MSFYSRLKRLLSKIPLEFLFVLCKKPKVIRTGARTTEFPLFEVASNPQIQLSEIRQRRFYMVDRAQIQAREEMQRDEDIRIMEIAANTMSRSQYNWQIPNFHIIGFKPSKENLFKVTEKESPFKIYGIK